MSRDGFLSRWSRRKIEARTVGEADPPAASAVPMSNPPVLQEGPEAPAIPSQVSPEAAGSISAREIAALPRIEDIRAGTDLVPFLRQGVPALLRKAVLRRMWSLDPAIRDFVGEARDYGYDWNVIGGVPGSGPLLAGDETAATLARMFRRGDEAPSTSLEDEGSPEQALDPSEVAPPAPCPVGQDATNDHANGAEAPGPDGVEPELSSEEKPQARRIRRHGSAVPT